MEEGWNGFVRDHSAQRNRLFKMLEGQFAPCIRLLRDHKIQSSIKTKGNAMTGSVYKGWTERGVPRVRKSISARSCLIVLLVVFLSGCSHYHYPVNRSLKQPEPQEGYRGRTLAQTDSKDDLMILLTFSGGGTRAAAFSYGVLETLRDTEVSVHGREESLLDHVDVISGVSGGSFTAAYYGLFRDRIFEDFESKFLKKNIQGDLARGTFLNPFNWVKILSPYYGRSDFAADYYQEHLFDGRTFGDMPLEKPMILINATDMVHGTRFTFNQDVFDVICSDMSTFPVGRACAASSAVPGLLSPITLRNYANTCGFEMPEVLRQSMEHPIDTSSRRFDLAHNMLPFFDSEKKPFIHLVDGGVADNLGLRAILERIILMGDPWATLQYLGMENVTKIVFVVVNAETEVDTKWDTFSRIPTIRAMIGSFPSIAIGRYNLETLALLRESLSPWAEAVRKGRCGPDKISLEPGSCGDIEFYLVEVNFDALEEEAERSHLKRLPTSFVLKPEEVDRLRDAARHILTSSGEFRRLVQDLQQKSETVP